MASAHEVLIKLAADASGLISGVNQANSALSKFDGVVGKLRGGLAGLGVSLSIGGFVSMARETLNAADAINDMSIRTGVAASTLKGFELVAQQSGVGLDDVAKAIAKLQLYMGKAGEDKRLAQNLSNLGITAKDPEQAFLQLTSAVEKMGDPNRRAVILNELLGKSYSALIPMLTQGGGAIAKMVAEQKKLNPQFDEFAKRADLLNDRLSVMAAKWERVKIKATEAFLAMLPDRFTMDEDKARMLELRSEITVLERSLKGSGPSKLSEALFGTKEERQQELAKMKAELATLTQKLAAPAPKKIGITPSFDSGGGGKKKEQETDWWSVYDMAPRLKVFSESTELAWQGYKDATANSMREATEAFERESQLFDAEALNEERLKAYDDYMGEFKDRFETMMATIGGKTNYGDMGGPFKELLDQAKKDKEALKAVSEIVSKEEYAAGLENINAYIAGMTRLGVVQGAQTAMGRVEADYRAQMNLLQAQTTTGVLGETDARTKSLAIGKETLAAMQPQIGALQDLANIGFPPAIAALKEYSALLLNLQDQAKDKTWLDGVKQGLDDFAGRFHDAHDAMRSATVRAFDSMTDSLTQFVMTGKLDFKSLSNSIIADMIRIQIQQNITKPLAFATSAMFSSFFGIKNAQGGVYSGAGIGGYSNSIVNSPTVFPFARGVGLMGEAGAEAIMPLKRGADGNLGVRVSGESAPVSVNFTINAIDTQSAAGVILANKSAIISVIQGAFNKAGRTAPMIA